MEKKSNWQEYEQVLKEGKITKLYHFTDRDNLESIIKHGGLYSWKDCEDKGIKIAKPGGSGTSRSLDQRDGLQYYARLSFVPDHPMMFVAMDDGRDSCRILWQIGCNHPTPACRVTQIDVIEIDASVDDTNHDTSPIIGHPESDAAG